MKCGAYEKVITPALGLLIPGYFVQRPAEDVLDDLYCKALVFTEGEELVGFAVADILHVRADHVKKIRERFTKFTGVCGDGIMVAATHSHTGQAVEYNDEFGVPDPTWDDIFCEKCADALIMAYQRQKECVIGFGKGEDHTLAYNRRFWKKDGKGYTWPGRCNPDNVKEAAPIDPELDVIRIDTPDGEPIAVITNSANHLDLIGGCKYSADYPGEISRQIKKALGDNVISVFMNGCCGDVTHIDYNTTDPYPADYYITVGKKMAEMVLDIYKNIETKPEYDLGSASEVREIPRRQPTFEMYQEGKRQLEEWAARDGKKEQDEDDGYEKPSTSDADLMALSYAKCNVSLYENPILSETPEIQVIRIGDIVFNGLPGEMFVELGLDIKARSKFEKNINVELANGCYGYIATRRAFDEGGYEVTLDRYVNMHEDTGDIMVNSTLELQEELI